MKYKNKNDRDLENWKFQKCKKIQCRQCVELNTGQDTFGCGGRYAI